MGSCKVDTSGGALMGISNYSNPKQLKKLYRNYFMLEKEALKGNQIAHNILIDLKSALMPNKRILTKKQLFCITRVLIENYTLEETSEMLNCHQRTIEKHINGGLKRISVALQNGEVYNNVNEFILRHMDKMTDKQMSEELNIPEHTVRYKRMKIQG